jgi:hypothetical protein
MLTIITAMLTIITVMLTKWYRYTNSNKNEKFIQTIIYNYHSNVNYYHGNVNYYHGNVNYYHGKSHFTQY